MATALLMGKSYLIPIGILGAIMNLVGFSTLLYETTMDIAGYPEYALPVWIVLYLVVYLISGFTFMFYVMHLTSPGYYFSGFASNNVSAFLDAFYVSASNYLGTSSVNLKVQESRLLSVGNGIASMILNVVIITKFVNTF